MLFRSKTEQRLYGELVHPTEASQVLTAPVVEQQLPQTSDAGYLRTLALIENKALLLQQNQQFYLMSLAKLQTLNYELTLQQGEISQQPWSCHHPDADKKSAHFVHCCLHQWRLSIPGSVSVP